MANFEPWEITNEGSSGTAHGKITLVSNGWSGNVVKNDGENNHFQFDVTGEGSYAGDTYTIEASGGYAFGAGGQIIGISLEHMGYVTEEASNQETVQFLGMISGDAHYIQFVPAWGAYESDTEITVDNTTICVEAITINEDEYENRAIAQITMPYVYAGIRTLCDGNWYAVDCDITITTDLPIFETDADLLAYCRSGGTDTSHILNPAEEPDPEEKYKNQFKHWYIRSVYGHNTRNSQNGGNVSHNYIFSPKDEGICFLMRSATKNSPYTLELKHYSGYTAKTAGRGVYDEDEYVPAPQVATMYLDRSISFGSDNYWTKFEWESNIPRFETEQQCDDYFNGIIDITSASNYAQIARIDNEIIQSDWAGLERDELTSLGTNGMQYGYGLRLYAMTSIELASLFNELFDRANINDILDGTKLYGSASDCVAGIMYLPINDLSAICNLGSLSKVWIGSWQAENAEGKRIINNTGLIDCGSFTMTPSYCDFRDFEPYTLLFVMLPFIGFKQLTLSKYLSQSTPKTISVKYAIDVSTGGCCAMLLADGKLMDLFEGTCGASRPFSAIDNNGYVNQCISAITGASNSASGSVSGVANAVSDAGKMATKSGAMGALGVAGVAVAGAGTTVSGIYQGYQIKQAVDNPPIMQRGNLTGNLSYYTVDKVTFLIAKKRSIRPENELNVIGYPSGHGGTVGQFSGFLKCSAFMLADGFIGSEAERAMILDEMEKGVYI